MIVVHVIFNLEEVDKQSEVLSKGRMWHPALVTIVIKKIEMVFQVKCDKTAHLGLNVTNVRNIVHVGHHCCAEEDPEAEDP